MTSENKASSTSLNPDNIQFNLGAQTFEHQEQMLQQQANNISLLVSTDDELYQRYLKNLQAFKEYYPEIYEFYSQYEPSKFVVDTVDGFVNAVNVENGDYLYHYPSYLVTKQQFDTFLSSKSIKTFNFAEEALSENDAEFIHADLLENLKGVSVEQANHALANRKHLSSLLIFGVGTGYHIEMLAQKFTTQCMYIVEPDLDLFFLSFFSINWQHILEAMDKKGGGVFISIGEQKDTFFNDFTQATRDRGQYQISHIAGYIHYQSKQINELLDEFNRRYFEIGLGWGFFDDGVISLGNMLGNLEIGVPMLNKFARFENNVSDIPVFVVGSGPSLDGLIEIIKEYQNRAVIISCGSATSALHKYGITPDIHCEQERTLPVAQALEHYAPKEFLRKLLLVAPNVVHPEVFQHFDRSIMMAKSGEPATSLLLSFEGAQDLFTEYSFISPTVTNTGLCVGFELGFKQFYFCGVDLGHKKGGNHHSVKSLYYTQDSEDKGLYLPRDDQKVEIPGNFGGVCLADHFFLNSNRCFEAFIKAAPDMRCFNLSDGALVKGAKPTTIDDLVDTFKYRPELDKKVLMDKVYADSIETDNQSIYEAFANSLEIDEFAQLCQDLKEFSSQSVTTFKQAIDLLEGNTKILRKSSGLIHDLLVGTLSHVQVTLNQMLYGSETEAKGLERFKKGLTLYLEFLAQAPEFYRDNADKKHDMGEFWWITQLKSFAEV